MKKINHDLVCEECGKPAKYNISEQVIHYEIDNNGNYTEITNEFSGCNDFYCEEHYNLINK